MNTHDDEYLDNEHESYLAFFNELERQVEEELFAADISDGLEEILREVTFEESKHFRWEHCSTGKKIERLDTLFTLKGNAQALI